MVIRKLFEKREGYCDECGKPFKITIAGKIRHSYGEKIICATCYTRKKRQEERKPLIDNNYVCEYCHRDIKDLKIKKRYYNNNKVTCIYCRSKLLNRLIKERNAFLRSIPPEELIRIVNQED